jgi:hypothetical protein
MLGCSVVDARSNIALCIIFHSKTDIILSALAICSVGWVYDPTGYSDTLDSSLNRVNVTLTQCKLACVAADDCTGFYWDEGLKVCGLQKGVCPYVQNTIPGCGDASQCQTTPCGSPLVSTCSYQQYTPNSPAPPIPGTYECGYAVTYIRKSVDLPSGCVAPVAK